MFSFNAKPLVAIWKARWSIVLKNKLSRLYGKYWDSMQMKYFSVFHTTSFFFRFAEGPDEDILHFAEAADRGQGRDV